MRRFVHINTESPGPGAYDSALNERGREFRIGTAPRDRLCLTPTSPGPGAYDVNRIYTARGLSRRAESSKHFGQVLGIFESSINTSMPAYSIGRSMRQRPFAGISTPSPADYSPKKDSKRAPAFSVGRSIRKSLSNLASSPGPAQYEPKDQLPSSPKFSMKSRYELRHTHTEPVWST
jgi:hypothetical protein